MKKLSHTSTHQSEGFTIIELLVFVAVIAAAGLFAIVNIRSVRSENRDSSQKTDINTIVYQLESSYQKKNFYPKNIDATTLKGIDQDTLVDANGIKINETSGSYVGETVLSPFSGVASEGYVALKTGRKYIGIEIGEHAYSHVLNRMKSVVDGSDDGGQ